MHAPYRWGDTRLDRPALLYAALEKGADPNRGYNVPLLISDKESARPLIEYGADIDVAFQRATDTGRRVMFTELGASIDYVLLDEPFESLLGIWYRSQAKRDEFDEAVAARFRVMKIVLATPTFCEDVACLLIELSQ